MDAGFCQWAIVTLCAAIGGMTWGIVHLYREGQRHIDARLKIADEYHRVMQELEKKAKAANGGRP